MGKAEDIVQSQKDIGKFGSFRNVLTQEKREEGKKISVIIDRGGGKAVGFLTELEMNGA